ncbi:MAG: manganese efflux pump MntP family protein [Christensenellales bacterium]
MGIEFYLRSVFLGAGLAMDACTVSMTNGFKDSNMRFNKMLFIAVIFGLFQGAMPLIAYFIGHSLLFIIKDWVPWISLFILSILGINMIINAKSGENERKDASGVNLKLIFMQAVATSLDALSVGLTFANYSVLKALICALIIALITVFICLFGVAIGKKFGEKLGAKAEVVGGLILIAIGLEIFISSFC